MLKELIKLSNDLDKKGLIKEADHLDEIISGIINNTAIKEGVTDEGDKAESE